VQLGADEAEPLAHAGPTERVARDEAGARVGVGDVLQHGGVLRQHLAALQRQGGHQSEAVDAPAVGAVARALRPGVDLHELDRLEGWIERFCFVQGDAGRKGTGHGGKVELHECFLLAHTLELRARGVQPLFSDEIVFLVSAQHPLAGRPSLTRRQLSEHPLIISTQTPKAEQRWFLNGVFGRSLPRLEFLRFPLTEAIIDAARAGMGIAVLSEWIASGYLPSSDLVVKRLDGKPLARPWRIAFRREASESAAVLARALESAAPRVHSRARV
jgi:hypothetical protein